MLFYKAMNKTPKPKKAYICLLKQVTVVASSANQSPGRSVAMPGGQAITLSQSVVNQLIQSGQLKAQPGTTVKAVSGMCISHLSWYKIICLFVSCL